MYSRIRSTKSAASGAGNVKESEADVTSRESALISRSVCFCSQSGGGAGNRK